MKPQTILAGFLVCVFMVGCAVMSNFDQNTYDSALSLKSESLSLVGHVGEPSKEYTEEIMSLKVKLSAQLAYEQGKGKQNVISAKQWEILISEDHDLLGKLLKDWQDNTAFSVPFLVEKRQQISDGFDQIIRLEGSKAK